MSSPIPTMASILKRMKSVLQSEKDATNSCEHMAENKSNGYGVRMSMLSNACMHRHAVSILNKFISDLERASLVDNATYNSLFSQAMGVGGIGSRGTVLLRLEDPLAWRDVKVPEGSEIVAYGSTGGAIALKNIEHLHPTALRERDNAINRMNNVQNRLEEADKVLMKYHRAFEQLQEQLDRSSVVMKREGNQTTISIANLYDAHRTASTYFNKGQ